MSVVREPVERILRCRDRLVGRAAGPVDPAAGDLAEVREERENQEDPKENGGDREMDQHEVDHELTLDDQSSEERFGHDEPESEEGDPQERPSLALIGDPEERENEDAHREEEGAHAVGPLESDAPLERR